MTCDAIVIGAGHNGLIAGCYLARGGLDVVVLEAQPKVGGMSSTGHLIPEAPEHRINPCALDICFIHASGILQELELARFGYRELEVDPFNVYLHAEGASIAFWRDPARTAAEIRHFSREDGEAYLQLVRTLDAALDLGLPFFTSNPRRPSPRALARMATATARHRRGLGQIPGIFVSPVAQTIDERFRHPIVRDAIAAQCGVVAPITSDGSGLQLLFFPFTHRFGVHRVVGGTQGLPDALAAAMLAGGGAVRTGAVVEEIRLSGGRAVGVRLAGGEELTARRGVIATCDPRTALGSLLPSGSLEPSMEARVAHIPACGDGWGDLKVDVALSGQLSLERHDKWRGDGLDLRTPAAFIGGYDQAVASYSQARAGQVPSDIGMWAVIPTAVDASQAPPGQDTLHLWANPMPLAPSHPWADASKEVIARAAEFYDGIEELEIGRWVESPQDRALRLRATNGCLYHTDMTLLRMGPFRPAPGLAGYRTPVPGLYLGGAGSHPAAAVTGLPGRLAARELLRRRC